MNISKLTRAVALSVTAAAFSAGASAVTITNPSGTFDFGGFDWASSGAAWTNNLTVAEQAAGAGQCSGGSPAAACNFTITYVALATALYDSNAIDLELSSNSTAAMDTSANGTLNAKAYEYTIFATINATMTSFSAGGGSNGADELKYFVNPSSTFTIYYDNTPDALQQNGAWSGFNNGTPMVQGNWQSFEQTFDAGQPNQGLSVFGAVTMSGSQFSPALTGTIVSSTLQLFPTFTGTFARPTSVDGIVLPAVGLADDEALFRADTNQDFFVVPEPTALALSAMALLAMGATARRRRQG